MKEIDGKLIAAVVIVAIALIIAFFFDEFEWTDGSRSFKARKTQFLDLDAGSGPMILEGN